MKLLAQHGFGKKNMIDDAIAQGTLQGAILSPRYETRNNLQAYVQELSAHDDLDLLIDPSAYCTSVRNARLGKLIEYPISCDYENPRRFSVRRVRDLVSGWLGYQANELPGLSHLVSPSLFIEGLNSRTAQTSLNFIETTLDFIQEQDYSVPVIQALLFDENSLKARANDLDEFLDDLTLYDIAGFYIIVKRDGEYIQTYDPATLANLMQLIYVLSEQGYYIVIGYSDLVSLLIWSSGANCCASGWYHALRVFSFRAIEPTTGGRAARERYTSSPLLNSIFFHEFLSLEAKNALALVSSGTSADSERQSQTSADSVTGVLHHWEVMDALKKEVQGLNLTDRLTKVQEMIYEAQRVYGSLITNYGATFGPLTGPSHLDDWTEALNTFKSRFGF